MPEAGTNPGCVLHRGEEEDVRRIRAARGKGSVLLLAAFVFFTLAAIFAGFPSLHHQWPWLVPGGLAAYVLARLD